MQAGKSTKQQILSASIPVRANSIGTPAMDYNIDEHGLYINRGQYEFFYTFQCHTNLRLTQPRKSRSHN
ncbi:hypothetical protein ILYODFUR_028646 [Ilyodon furcidens]|uniref:Uncharacterized protein n=1 Tax=Ilyodon furcidens TaxID=33524 RepID=A0ABV0UYZ7_9TELE